MELFSLLDTGGEVRGKIHFVVRADMSWQPAGRAGSLRVHARPSIFVPSALVHVLQG